MRLNNRANDELRKIKIEPNVNKYAEGSCMVSFGDTQVLCLATVEDKLPNWLKGSGKGWITAEYGMLPRSTEIRMDREAVKGSQNGRTQEIQRLVSRSLRAAVDLHFIPDIGIKVDCDVIQADGGTRTAAVTGGFVAMYIALQNIKKMGLIKKIPLISTVAAVSCGIVNGQMMLDLDYNEDCNAETDANFCILGKGSLVEVQATAEKGSYTREMMNQLLDLAYKGTEQIAALQREVLSLQEV